jgi:AraC family transcriptional regulator
MFAPAVPELVLIQDVLGGRRTRGDAGGGYYDVLSEKGNLYLAAPNFAHTMNISTHHHIRTLSFPTEQWQSVLDEVAEGGYSPENLQLYKGAFRSQAIQSALRNLWALSDEEGATSRLLARAAGCEILAELCRLSGASLAPARGGLAPWAKRRCLELMQERLSEDISLDELAAEAQLSPFHFARMFKESVGVPPRVYLTRLRLERACELLETTNLPVTEIAFEVGYSSNQVLARLFVKHRHMTPSDYRRAVRDPVLSSR